MKKLLLIPYLFLLPFGIAFGDSYFSLHYNNVLGSFGYSPSNDEVNICVYDNGTTDDCANNHPSIISNTYYDNGTISGTSNSPLDNDTRFFEEKMRIGLGTMRLSAGFGSNFLEGTIIGLGTRYGLTTGIVSIYGKENKTILEGSGPLFGVEFEIFTLHDKLSFFGFFPFYRYTYYISSSNVYILGENKLSKYYVRNSYQLKSSSHQWGGSFKFPIISNVGSKKGKSKSNTSGIFIDLYRDMTLADLKIKGITTKVKSSNNGYSIKYSMPF